MFKQLGILALALAAGCNTNLGGKDFVAPLPPVIYSATRPATPDAGVPGASQQNLHNPLAPRPEPPRPAVAKAVDPPPLLRPAVGLSVFQLSVPVGTVSRSEAFWKRIEERAIDAGAYDILQKNGLRTGLGAVAELDDVIRQLDRSQLQPQPAVFIASNVKTVELPMKRAVPEQTIYDFDLKDNLTVRTYEEADDLFLLQFAPAPRKAGDVRLSLCPLIRTLRKRLVPISDIETQEIEFRSPEKFFQLNLKLDLPLDNFLVLAPSPQAQAAMSLGHTFLVNHGDTQKYETILIIVPQVTKLPTPKSAEAKK